MPPQPDEHLAVLKASYDYTPQSDDEIAIKEDQILFLKERVDEDWWKVKVKGDTQDNDGPEGLVPAAYVEQADHTSLVKALYAYDASAPGELTISEDEILLAFDSDDDWLLAQSTKDGGRAGYVPANYVEPHTEEGEEAVAPATPQIIVPPDPPRPTSTYVDPAVRVASSKLSADDIKTWSVSELDKKGKKMKGTLGIGNGAVFFASETSKAAVQKWQTGDIDNITIEKSKHVLFNVNGPSPTNLRFSVGSKDNAEAIVAKLESSRALSRPSVDQEPEQEVPQREKEPPASAPRFVPPPLHSSPKEPKKATVHFSPASPVIIPPREQSIDEDDAAGVPEDDGETAVVLYDFKADGDDELTVSEGEHLLVIDKDDNEWWKCRNTKGNEGVVPASYIELTGGDSSSHRQPDEDDDDEEARLAAAAVAAQEEEEREREEAARVQREKEEKERKKQEAAQRAKDAAAAAEEERIKRKQASTAAAAKSSPPPSSPSPSADSKKDGPSQSGRGSIDNGRPPPEKVRVWHDRTGQFRVDAAFLGFNSGKLRLHKTNGVIVEVPAEKMSAEDMRYVEKMMSRHKPSKKVSDDDIPLAVQHPQASKRASHIQQPKKAPRVDWFDFFLNAGCDVDDCTRYAASFERDKIDATILGDITDATMRSLGLREGDIIRVTKAIQTMKPRAEKDRDNSSQIAKDEELARQLQAEENAARTKTPPSLFAGPGGALKASRRGRPKPSGSLPPATVDMTAIGAITGGQRTSSPQLLSPVNRPSSTSAVQPPPRSSSALPTSGGFEDDAWTPRNKPASPAPAAAFRAPSAPPSSAASAPTPAAAPPAPVLPVQPSATSQPAPAARSTPSNLASTTESDIFDQLARLSELRKHTPALSPPSTQTPPVSTGFQSGLGMGSSPVPMGQHMQTVQNGATSQTQQPYVGPRGPFAPVPTNQGLLQPLIPTQTGFNSFVPTRPGANVSPFANPSPFANSPQQQPSFLQSQPTGFPGMQQPLMSQPTGLPFGGMNGMNGGMNGGGLNPIQATGSFGSVATNPTGFNPSFGGSFNSGISSPPPVPPLPSSTNNTNPANIFAQMKSGTFANDNDTVTPQPSDKYDALRPNPLTAQATGWGGYQGGFVGYR